jgi:hypothetical protein
LSHEEKKKKARISYLERAKQQYPEVPLFKQKIIARFLEIQDELRRLKKRYAKAGLPLILMKE